MIPRSEQLHHVFENADLRQCANDEFRKKNEDELWHVGVIQTIANTLEYIFNSSISNIKLKEAFWTDIRKLYNNASNYYINAFINKNKNKSEQSHNL